MNEAGFWKEGGLGGARLFGGWVRGSDWKLEVDGGGGEGVIYGMEGIILKGGGGHTGRERGGGD